VAIYLAFGSNLGDRAGNIARAREMLEPEVRVEAVSALYETEPVGGPPQPPYLNGACRVTTTLEPHPLLDYVKGIETRLGRRPGVRWGPRPIDIDIVLYDDRVVLEVDLTIPHPRMLERIFVLRPLVDLDPDLVHPITGERLADVLARLDAAGSGDPAVGPENGRAQQASKKLF
jgi:2-amino-4-hydroxy-6-hydroxymethyldihydropteridine diphosphokinase